MIVVPALRARLGVTTRPDTHIDRVDRRRFVERMLGEEGADRLSIDLAASEASIQAAPAASVDRLKAQVHR
jgi:hypothetical protein